ncbi:uncharacterized protein LOC143288103 [Babylonia areolata]|uniref:uncharacterized protein LOC143288103 n=1 Tax=Babylonia areolata TaxID=304850 RepID=UPI003FD5B3EB
MKLVFNCFVACVCLGVISVLIYTALVLQEHIIMRARPSQVRMEGDASVSHLNSVGMSVQGQSSANKTIPVKVELFPNWTTTNPHDERFTRRVFIYSAIVALHNVPPYGTEIHFVIFQDGRRLLNLTCCAKPSDTDEVYIGHQARLDFSQSEILPNANERDLQLVGAIYSCWFPLSSRRMNGAHATLTSTSCPRDLSQYLPVHQPVRKPGGLAVCAKIAYGLRLDPNKLVEWFEMQRLLGVDRIQLFDLNNTDIVHKVFKHYQDSGLLDLLPYKLPGRPWGRFVLKDGRDWTRYGDDKVLPIWDCRLRLAGFKYVSTVDMDEFIFPRGFTSLKAFLRQQFDKQKIAAVLKFKPVFFLDHWGPVDPNASLMFLRYLNCTDPKNAVIKTAYLPERTHQAHTHNAYPYKPFTAEFVKPETAVVFHYRACKKNWKFSCDGPRNTDRSMLKFADKLIPAVSKVRHKVGLHLHGLK